MNPNIAAFKRIAAQVADRDGFSMDAFIGEYGLQDFLVDEADNRDAVDFGAKALLHFCVVDGHFSGFLVGLKTALQFLNERLDAPSGDAMKQCLSDLQKVLSHEPTLNTIKQWIKSHYR